MISSQGIMSRYECSGCSRDGPIAAAQVREIWVGNTGGGVKGSQEEVFLSKSKILVSLTFYC